MHYFLWGIFWTVFVAIAIKIYLKLSTGWCRSATFLGGKTVIVTGSNCGIGYEGALDFAKRGARVILACRDKKKAEDAKTKIIEETGNENIVVRLVDLASFQSVRKFAQDIITNEDRLDILVNNAGVAGISDVKSEDGYLLLMQINYYSHFLLTILLIKLLKKSAPSRIVNVSSEAAWYPGELDLDKINEFPGRIKIYRNSKLCQIYFTKELAKRLQGSGVTSYSLHPGTVKTEIFRNTKGGPAIILSVLKNLFFKTSLEGAQTTIYTSVAKGIEIFNGEHFSDCARISPYGTAKDASLDTKLWNKTAEIVQFKPEELQF